MVKKATTRNVPLTQEQVLMLKSLLDGSQRKMVEELGAAVKEKDERKQAFYIERLQDAQDLEKVLDKADARTYDTSEDVVDEDQDEKD